MTNRAPREERLRLFVAIELPEAWQEALAEVQEKLRGGLAAIDERARFSWTRPEGMHLTLKFIGEVSPEHSDAIQRALLIGIEVVEPFSVHLDGFWSFGGRPVPRVLAARIGDDKPIAALARQVDDSLSRLGIKRETREFRAHVTLARIPATLTPATWKQLSSFQFAFVHTPRVPAFIVDHVSLMRSFLGPGGARYERVARFPA
jgi:2'-5' RNA ligase